MAISLREQCFEWVNQWVDRELSEAFNQRPLLSVTAKGRLAFSTWADALGRTPRVLKDLRAEMRLPHAIAQGVTHPFFLAEKAYLGQDTEEEWQSAFKKESLSSGIGAEEALSWRQRYLAARIQQVFTAYCCDFTRIDPKTLSFFYCFRTLVGIVDVSGSASLTGEKLKELTTLFSHATSWRLSRCYGLRERDFLALVPGIFSRRKLEGLDLSLNGFEVTTAVVEKISARCRALKTLNLFGICADVESQALIAVTRANPSLESLTVGGYVKMTNEELVALLTPLSKLNRLCLQRFPRLDCATLESLLSHLPLLKNLEIVDCAQLALPPTFLQDHTQLRHLSLRNCS